MTLTVVDTTSLDTLTISGIQVQAANGTPLPSSGTILRTSANPGTATLPGINNDITSFGALSEIAGTAVKLAFTTQPNSAVAGTAFGVQPVIKTQDQFGNNSTVGLAGNRNVTVSLSFGTGPLQGASTLNIGTSGGNGTVTFTTLQIDVAGINKQLTAAASGLGTVPSSVFTVSPGPANRLIIQTQPPVSATAGLPFAPQPVVRIEDAYGNLRNSDSGVLITAARNSGAGTLQGALTIPTLNGIASFTNLSHNVATTINLIFSSGSLASATSSDIFVKPAIANRLAFSSSPAGAFVGAIFGTQPVVKTQDDFGNDSIVGLGAARNVTLTLTSGSGPLLGTTTLDLGTGAGNGVATFTDLRINVAGGGDQLTANASGLTNALSSIFTVEKGNQTITFGSLSDKTYGDPAFTPIATASSGLAVSFSIDSGPATALNNLITITGAGLVTVRASQNGDSNWNPATSVPQSSTVLPASLTVTADNKSKYYGDINPPLTFTYNGFVNHENESVLTGTQSLSTTATTNSPVASSPIPILIDTGSLITGNYTYTFISGNLTVNPAVLTSIADDKSRLYGDTNPVFTAFYTGFVNGETETVLTGVLTGITTATTNSSIGNYPITLSGQSAANYSIDYIDGTLTITEAPLDVTADNTNRTYGAANPSFTGLVTGIRDGDTITATYDTPATTTSPIDGYPIIPTLVDPDDKLGNYSVTYNNGTLTVLPALLNGHADNKTRAYGETNPVFTVTYTGFVNSEDESIVIENLIGSTPATTNSPVGTYPIHVGGQSASNYKIKYFDGTLTVTGAVLTVTADDKSRAYGQVNPDFTAHFSGFVNGEDTNVLSGTLSFATSATTNSPIGKYDIVPSGFSSDNYAINYTNGTLTVTPYDLSVTADNTSRPYGGSNPTFTGSLLGVQNGDGITATYTTSATEASNVGTYDIVPQLSGDAQTNYTVHATNGTLTITSVGLLVLGDDTNRLYGAVNPVFTGAITGISNSDNIFITYTTEADTNSPVGN